MKGKKRSRKFFKKESGGGTSGEEEDEDLRPQGGNRGRCKVIKYRPGTPKRKLFDRWSLSDHFGSAGVVAGLFSVQCFVMLRDRRTKWMAIAVVCKYKPPKKIDDDGGGGRGRGRKRQIEGRRRANYTRHVGFTVQFLIPSRAVSYNARLSYHIANFQLALALLPCLLVERHGFPSILLRINRQKLLSSISRQSRW